MSDQDMLFNRNEQPSQPSQNVPQPTSHPQAKRGGRLKRSGGGSKVKILVFALIALAIIGTGSVIGYSKYNNLKKENAKLSNPTEAAKAETESLVAEVGKAIELPSETPTIATVKDVSKLKSQAFFANAQNGDKVLIFTQAKKAVLYRASTKKVIEVAPINIGNNSQTQGDTTTKNP